MVGEGVFRLFGTVVRVGDDEWVRVSLGDERFSRKFAVFVTVALNEFIEMPGSYGKSRVEVKENAVVAEAVSPSFGRLVMRVRRGDRFVCGEISSGAYVAISDERVRGYMSVEGEVFRLPRVVEGTHIPYVVAGLNPRTWSDLLEKVVKCRKVLQGLAKGLSEGVVEEGVVRVVSDTRDLLDDVVVAVVEVGGSSRSFSFRLGAPLSSVVGHIIAWIRGERKYSYWETCG